jgi:hypothetical protein
LIQGGTPISNTITWTDQEITMTPPTVSPTPEGYNLSYTINTTNNTATSTSS